jgi:hypothetical protein
MAYITNYNYYENGGVVPTDANHGSYQFISLRDIVNNYMLVYVGDDKTVDNVEKHIVRFHAKQTIKQLNFKAFRQIQAIERIIGDDLKMVMPHDCVNYVRVSLCKNDILYPMVENNTLIVTSSYLQDNNLDLTFDGAGEVLTGEKRVEVVSSANLDEYSDGCCHYKIGARFGMDPSLANKNPKFKIDRNRGVIDFDSTMSGESVVLEYISDGMENGDDSLIVVNKLFEKYMYSNITYEILDSKHKTPIVRLDNAKKKRKAERSNAYIAISDIDPSKILMTLRGQDKWIK